MSQTDAQWGGGPGTARGKARWRGAAGRSPGVRPVLEPVFVRLSGEGGGEKSRRGRGAERAGEAAELILEGAVAEVVMKGMVLLEARKAARGVKTRGGVTRTVKVGWLATCMVARRECRVTVVSYVQESPVVA